MKKKKKKTPTQNKQWIKRNSNRKKSVLVTLGPLERSERVRVRLMKFLLLLITATTLTL